MKHHLRGARALRTLIAAAGISVLVGCYQQTYTIGSGARAGGIVYDQWQHHWLWGLISPTESIEVANVCASGNATIHSQTTFVNGLVSALTSGIFSPTTVTIRCNTGQDAGIELTPDDVARIVADPSFLDWVGTVTPELLDEATQAQRQLDR